MDDITIARQIRQLHLARPFRPFRIHLADGRRLEVARAEFLAYTPSGRSLIITKADETFEVVNVGLLTSVEIIRG